MGSAYDDLRRTRHAKRLRDSSQQAAHNRRAERRNKDRGRRVSFMTSCSRLLLPAVGRMFCPTLWRRAGFPQRWADRRINHAATLLRLKQYQPALAQDLYVMRSHPDDALPHSQAGIALSHLSRFDEAISN